MTTDYLSLSELAGRLERYDRLPVTISQNMQATFRRAALVSGIAIPFYTLGTHLFVAIAEGWYGLLSPWGLIGFPAEIAFFLAALTESLSPILLVLNAISLGVMGALFWRSKGFIGPVEEVFHWLGAAGVVVAAVSAICMAIVTIGFLTNLVLALALWVLLGLVFLFIFGVCLAVLVFAVAVSAGS